ncbi:MAG: pilus assembly protein TadG-related protein, partial [Chloroflexota bacterium]
MIPGAEGAEAARGGECGQVLIIFALALTALMAMLALVIDLGLLFGQRRFDQNSADAAAFAAGRMLAGAASPLGGGGGALYFTWPDAEIYREVRRYAGLNPDDASTIPTGINRNAGLVSRTRLAVTLEYSPLGGWCYSPSGPPPPRRPAPPPCELPVVEGVAYPPLPAADRPYRIRVTVSSTTRGVFAGLIGAGNLAPPPAGQESTPACLRATGAAGNVSCAQAIVAVTGSTTYQGVAPTVPVTTADCQISAPTGGALFQFWGASPDGCGVDLGPWKNLLDFTVESKWCDTLKGSGTSDPDYRYTNLLPPGAQVAGGPCASERADPSWTREGYRLDPHWPGSNEVKLDVPYWIAAGFGGTLRASYADGNRFPTYVDLQASPVGDLGQNIAAGFYCGSSGVTATVCDARINPAGTYFFAKNQRGFHDVCPDQWGQRYGVG